MTSVSISPIIGRRSRETRSWSVPLVLVSLLAILLRLYRLDAVSLWTDELFTRFYPHAGLGYLWTEGLRTEPTSPLYYTLVWAVERTLGSSAWALRLPSVAASLLGIWLAFRLAGELFGRTAPALLAALVLALAPFNVFVAQEARAYALQGAALTLALFGFARLLRGARGAWWLYGVGATLAIWLHPTSVAAVIAFNAAAALSAVGRGKLLDRAALLRWIAVNAAVAVLCLPLLPAMLSPTGTVATSWIPAVTRWSLQRLLGVTLAGPALEQSALRVAEIGLPLLVALFLLPPWRPDRRAATVLLLVPGLAFLLMLGISLHRPILLSRTIAWMLVPLAVALGDVLSRRPKPLGIVVVAAVACAGALQAARIDGLKEDWRGFLANLPGLAPPALVVLAPHTSPAALAVYAPGAGAPVRMDDGSLAVPETTVIPRLFGTRTITRADLDAAIAAGRPVWLIYRRPDYEWMRQATAGLPPHKLAIQSAPGSNPAMRALSW